MSNLKNASTEELLQELESRKIAGRLNAVTQQALNCPVSPVGIWHVTTEGDVEGKTTEDLGVHEGHVVDIASKLANQAYYKLTFKVADPTKPLKPIAKAEVDVAINVGTGNMKSDERAAFFAAWLSREQPVEYRYEVKVSTSYAAVHLSAVKK